jgi:hypothetical protein
MSWDALLTELTGLPGLPVLKQEKCKTAIGNAGRQQEVVTVNQDGVFCTRQQERADNKQHGKMAAQGSPG